MTAFARSLGLETNGQQLRSLKDQLARLAAATVRMGVVEEGRAVQVNTQFVTRLRPVVPQAGRPARPLAVHGPAQRGVFPEPGPARRPARPPGRRGSGVVVDGAGRLRLAGAAAAPRAARQARSSSPGPPCTSSSGRGSPACAISAGSSCKPCIRSRRPTRLPGSSAAEVGLTLEHSPPPVPPRYTSVLTRSTLASLRTRPR